MNEQEKDDDLELELDRVSSLYQKIPDEEFSPEVRERIRATARRAVRRGLLERLLSGILGSATGAVSASSSRLQIAATASLFIAVTGLAGIFYVQSQSGVQPLLLTEEEERIPLLKDAEGILKDFNRISEMQPAKVVAESGQAELSEVVKELKDKKSTLSSAAKILEEKSRSKDSKNLLKAIDILDDQINQLEKTPNQ